MHPTLSQLQSLEPIRGLSAPRLEELSRLSECLNFQLGGDPLASLAAGGHLTYLLAGELRLTLPDGSMQLLVGGCDDARWPLGYKSAAPRASRAITDVVLLVLDFDLLDLMMTWDELSALGDAPAGTDDSAVDSLSTGAFSAHFLTSSVLAQLPPAHLHPLLQRFHRFSVRQGERVINEGEVGRYYYLIERGRCVVSKHIGGVSVDIAELRAGDAFGEEALVAETLRNASVTMKTDGVLLRLAKPDFAELLQEPLLHPVDRATAEARVASGQARWLDVRYPAEFTEDGLPGALNVPLNEIRSAFNILDRKIEYIVYCQSGRRSSAAAFLLAQNGFNAIWLRNGLGRGEMA